MLKRAQRWHNATAPGEVSLGGADDKLTQIDRRSRAKATANLGMPAITARIS
jgi:hypothetical protein